MVQEVSLEPDAAVAGPAAVPAGKARGKAAGVVAGDLAALPGNPIPPGARVAILTAGDGVRLRAARFPAAPGTEPRGTVCLFHGRSEQIEKYFGVIERLQRRGFVVATMDWRGQGGSQRLCADPLRAHVPDFRHYERDLDAFRRQVVLPDCPPPYFGLAHSMGCTVLLGAAARLTPWLSRVVLASPFFDFGETPIGRRSIRTVAGLLRGLGLSRSSMPKSLRKYAVTRRFEGNPLTSDGDRYQTMMSIPLERPDLSVGAPTIGWLHAAARALDVLDDRRLADAVRVPVLIVNAGSDRIVSPVAAERMARRLRLASYVLVPGARHELMMEAPIYAAQFWAAFDAFVPGGGPP